MKALCDELRAEYAELADLVEPLSAEQWALRSKFYGWTPFDEIAHLLFFDERGLLAATDPDAFAADAAAIGRQISEGREISTIARECYGHLEGAALAKQWRTCYEKLVATLAALDPKARLPWYGPPMGTRSFITARMMETWAHGQDIYDILGRRRPATARLKHIAHIGVTTFGWTFVNRRLDVPPVVPWVSLSGPGGEQWTWGEPSATDFVSGSAEEFCLVVTQRRNVADTGLRYGGTAAQWLPIAQCFAGPPADPPAAGSRAVVAAAR